MSCRNPQASSKLDTNFVNNKTAISEDDQLGISEIVLKHSGAIRNSGPNLFRINRDLLAGQLYLPHFRAHLFN